MDGINIIFVISDDKNHVYFWKRNVLLSFVVEKFKKDLGKINAKFECLYDGKTLDQNKTLKEYNLPDLTTIYVFERQNVTGRGLSVNFTDLSKNIYEEHYLSKTAHDYRTVSKGINVYGKCKGKKCKAYNKEVICPLKEKKSFNLLKEKDDLECPICGCLMIPKTLGFFSCEYRIKGKKCEDDIITPFELRDKASNKDSIRYFNPNKNGSIMFIELIVEVIEFL
jgi:hypothetical protein